MIRSRKQIIRRIISSLICLFVVILINFFLPRIMPGNPVLMLTGQDESSMSEEKMKEYETKLGLDKPLGQQFGDYLLHLIQGDLGFSYHNNDSVSNLLKKEDIFYVNDCNSCINIIVSFGFGTRYHYGLP